jgi:hypothetical protein
MQETGAEAAEPNVDNEDLPTSPKTLQKLKSSKLPDPNSGSNLTFK